VAVIKNVFAGKSQCRDSPSSILKEISAKVPEFLGALASSRHIFEEGPNSPARCRRSQGFLQTSLSELNAFSDV
jgi:hypothetical protein